MNQLENDTRCYIAGQISGITMVRAEDIPHMWTMTFSVDAYRRLYKNRQFIKRLKRKYENTKNIYTFRTY